MVVQTAVAQARAEAASRPISQATLRIASGSPGFLGGPTATLSSVLMSRVSVAHICCGNFSCSKAHAEACEFVFRFVGIDGTATAGGSPITSISARANVRYSHARSRSAITSAVCPRRSRLKFSADTVGLLKSRLLLLLKAEKVGGESGTIFGE